MRTMSLAVLCSLALACSKPVPPAAPTGPVGISHPDLDCPPNTIGMGAAPPAGMEIYCAAVDTSSTVTRQGPVIGWHSATRRAYTGSYLAGKKNSSWTYWHPSGTVDKQGSYSAGRMDGTWTTFHSDGTKASEGNYVSGREEGKWSFWAEDGSRRTTGTYENGGRQGIWIDHNGDNIPIRERKYRDGRLVTQRELSQEN